MADSFFNPNFTMPNVTPTASTATSATSAGEPWWLKAIKLAIPVAGTVIAGKAASPQKAAQTTAEQNALAMASLPPELKALLNIQTQNAQMAQPLYQNALSATNALLPTWARGGGSAGVGGASGSTGYAPTVPMAPNSNVTFDGGGDKSGQPYNDNMTWGAGAGTLDVPGNSLDPKTVLMLLSLLNPGAGLLSKVVKGPSSDTNFTMQ